MCREEKALSLIKQYAVKYGTILAFSAAMSLVLLYEWLDEKVDQPVLIAA